MEFSAIKSEVASWLLDLPAGATERIGGWVNEAIRDAAKRHNFKFMESNVAAVTVENEILLATKPATWKGYRGDPYIINQDASIKELDIITEGDMRRARYSQVEPYESNPAPVDSGSPRYIWDDATRLYVAPIPDLLSGWNSGNYLVAVPCWAFPAALVQDAETNWLTVNADYYVIWKSVSLGYKWNRDEERALYYQKDAEIEFQKAKRLDKMLRVPDKLVLRTHRDVYAGRSRSGNRG